MSIDIQASVVLVTSSDADNPVFGTGFVIGNAREAGYTYIVTCAHVIRDVGSTPKVEGHLAKIIAIDSTEHIDLAVLQVVGLSNLKPLALQQVGIEGLPIIITGWSDYGSFYGSFPRCLSINGILDRKVLLSGHSPSQRIDAWALSIPDTYTLQLGYSGSPVTDKESGNVVAVANVAEAAGNRGMAISIAALALIWQGMPSDLLKKSIQPLHESHSHTAAIYLAAHPKAVAQASMDETLVDWTSLFSAADPNPQIWANSLVPELEQHLLSYRKAHIRHIHLRASARNSVGFAFGFTFRKTSGFIFTIQITMIKFGKATAQFKRHHL